MLQLVMVELNLTTIYDVLKTEDLKLVNFTPPLEDQ